MFILFMVMFLVFYVEMHADKYNCQFMERVYLVCMLAIVLLLYSADL